MPSCRFSPSAPWRSRFQPVPAWRRSSAAAPGQRRQGKPWLRCPHAPDASCHARSSTVQRLDASVPAEDGGGASDHVTAGRRRSRWPLSSTTLQVTVIVPGAAPEVDRVAVECVPLTEPAVAAVAVGQRTILRARGARGDRGRATGINRRRVRRAADGWRLELH